MNMDLTIAVISGHALIFPTSGLTVLIKVRLEPTKHIVIYKPTFMIEAASMRVSIWMQACRVHYFLYKRVSQFIALSNENISRDDLQTSCSDG